MFISIFMQKALRKSYFIIIEHHKIFNIVSMSTITFITIEKYIKNEIFHFFFFLFILDSTFYINLCEFYITASSPR